MLARDRSALWWEPGWQRGGSKSCPSVAPAVRLASPRESNAVQGIPDENRERRVARAAEGQRSESSRARFTKRRSRAKSGRHRAGSARSGENTGRNESARWRCRLHVGKRPQRHERLDHRFEPVGLLLSRQRRRCAQVHFGHVARRTRPSVAPRLPWRTPATSLLWGAKQWARGAPDGVPPRLLLQ